MGASENHKDLVRAVKDSLVAAGVDLSGPCGAFEITKRVAWGLRFEGAGLLDKPSGNNCGGYATDIVCYSDGLIYDCLEDGGGENKPQWPDDGEQVDPERWREAVDPGGDLPMPEPGPGPNPPTPEPGPTPPPVSHISYDDYVKGPEAAIQQIADALTEYRGNYGLSDLAHFSWQLLVDGRSLDSVLTEIRG